jgi:hypothetical protein
MPGMLVSSGSASGEARTSSPVKTLQHLVLRDLEIVDGGGEGRLGAEPDVEVRSGFNLLDEVVGHALGERVAPHEYRDRGRMLGQVNGGLTGRVATADDEHSPTLQFLPGVTGTLKRFHSFLKRDGRLAAAVWGPPDTVQFALPVGVIFKELELPPPPPGRPGIFALADAGALARLVADAGYRDVETGTVTAVYETASPEAFTQWARDVAPPIVNLLKGQPPEVQESGFGKRSPSRGRRS